VPADELVNTHHGASTDFIKELKSLDTHPTVDQLVTMRIQA
jgi:hypothetical protein